VANRSSKAMGMHAGHLTYLFVGLIIFGYLLAIVPVCIHSTFPSRKEKRPGPGTIGIGSPRFL